MTEWNAELYRERSSLQQAMAAEVLQALELEGAERVLDVGCGDGRITAEIARRVPPLRIVSVFARVPGAMVIYELGYRMLAANRHRISAALGLKVCVVPSRGGST